MSGQGRISFFRLAQIGSLIKPLENRPFVNNKQYIHDRTPKIVHKDNFSYENTSVLQEYVKYIYIYIYMHAFNQILKELVQIEANYCERLIDLFGNVKDEWLENDYTSWIGANIYIS